MKRFFGFILMLAMVLTVTACASRQQITPVPTWQEQYDLGVRYLSEGNYKEAIIAFTAAIEIDPKRSDAYLSLADAYTGAGDTDAAKKTLEDALSQVDDPAALVARLAELSAPQPPDALDAEESEPTELPAGPTPLEGYPKTEREDWSDGRYVIWEYDQYGNVLSQTRHAADGQLEYRHECAYDENGIKIRCEEQWFEPNAKTRSVMEYDAEGRASHEVEYWQGDTKTFVYTYQDREVTVDMVIVSEQFGEVQDSFRYTMGESSHYIEIWGTSYSAQGIDVGTVVEFNKLGEDIKSVDFWET